MKKLLVTIFAIFAISAASHAQDYNWAVGVRLGGSAGIAAKYMVSPSNAIEGIISWPFGSNGVLLTGLYEWNMPVIANGFNFYYGVGAHLGAWSKSFAVGIDGIVGLEYKFPTIPFAMSIDYKPALNFLPDVNFWYWDFSLGLKYVF